MLIMYSRLNHTREASPAWPTIGNPAEQHITSDLRIDLTMTIMVLDLTFGFQTECEWGGFVVEDPTAFWHAA